VIPPPLDVGADRNPCSAKRFPLRESGKCHRAASRGAEKINQQLELPLQTVLAAMLPEAAELGVFLQAVHQIFAHSGDGLVTTR